MTCRFSNAVLFAALSLAAASVQAGEVIKRTESVYYGDLDLSRQADLKTLDRRVARAIDAVCGSFATVEEWQHNDVRKCRSAAREQARADIALVASSRPALAQK